MKKKKSRASAGKRAALTALCLVLGLVLVIMLGGTIYVEYLLNKMNYVQAGSTVDYLSQEEADRLAQEDAAEEGEDADFTGPELSGEDVEFSDANVQIGGDKKVVNILLIGQDAREGEERARSDSMILCTFNKLNNTITMTSFMRDMYVQIPGYKNNRINTAYTLGGMELLNETLNKNFGLQIDGNVEINFNHFKELIDLVGGIEIELSSSEASYLNKQAPGYETVSAGVNLLNGDQALVYARNRHSDSSGDFGRTNRQRIVLDTLINRYKDSSLTTLVSMMDDILPMVTTDLTKSEITSYVTSLFPMLATAEIVTQRVPVDGGYQQVKIDGMSVLRVDFEKNIQALVDSLTGGVG